MNAEDFKEQFIAARKKLGLTQAEVADRCNLNIRTIQRIEKGTVVPRSYTIRIVNNVLGSDLSLPHGKAGDEKELAEYRESFRRRKRIRLATFSAAMILMVAVAVLGFPTWELFGMPKRVWAPYFYLVMFAHIIGIALTWRCPGCNSILGDVFNTRVCSHCGLRFSDQHGKE